MRPIPQKHKLLINSSPYYKHCARESEGECDGRITIEHAFIYAGRQISEMWNYIPLCWHHHLGEGLDKHRNQLFALERATPEDLAKYPKAEWYRLKVYLQRIIYPNAKK